MNGGRVDASTSTDDIKGRPLCLFYFTHPFGVLSPDPPTIATAPDNITQAFLNMEPVSPYNFWSSTTQESYNTTPTTSSKVSYDVGNVMIPKKPINLISVPKYTVDFNLRRDSFPSSLFSNDMWLSTSSSCDYNRRLLPYSRILPPLELPTPNLTESSDDFWTTKPLRKVSLPPIDMPKKYKKRRRKVKNIISTSDESVKVREVKSEKSVVRVVGVKKVRKRVKFSGIRRMVNCLMQRAVKGRKELNSSPAIQEVLNTIREAWTEPKSLFDRCRALTRTSNARESTEERDENRETNTCVMLKRTQLAELPPRLGASPGLLRRRYSMPETIMRKYSLAQQRTDSDDSVATTAPSRAASPASPSPPRGSCASLCEPQHRFLRRDRELMRKSALLRRLWARPTCNPCPSCCYCSGDLYDSQGDCGRETKSLDGSRSELRHLSSSFTSSRYSRESHMLAGWSTPKRKRMESPNNFHYSDEMLRTAMKNSYDKAEESRHEREARDDLSDSTYQSHDHGVPYVATSSATPLTDSTKSDTNLINVELSSEEPCSECVTAQINSECFTSHETESISMVTGQTDDQTLTDTDSTISTSMSTAKETNGSAIPNNEQKVSKYGHINIRINEESDNFENNDKNIIPSEKPVKNETPPYEILEIVVSETLNSSAFDQNSVSAVKSTMSDKQTVHEVKYPITNNINMQNIDLDEYVSNILVESLNSLTNQLESMNASMGAERKVSIVEKEIKVKLQNTGVNTIVHLSPTSNNQIIFGNEELYNKEENKNICNNIQDHHDVSEEIHAIEFNNNFSISLDTNRDKNDYANDENYTNKNYEPTTPNDNVNKAVLQQIQKLFQDELQKADSRVNYPANMMPGISHIEISNVDVYIDNNTEPNYLPTDMITLETDKNSCYSECSFNEQSQDILSGVGTGNYYKNDDEPVLVPRFSAFPHTESMEVNTSSSDDAEVMGSDCTSLVDSLDDPNSPRSMLLRKTYHNSKLVRSAIDVLDLLPENAFTNHSHPKEKSESFFIRIKDNDCDCEKENIVVADHMPEKIRERLYRRHRKRELRMECARRKKVKQLKREMENQRNIDVYKSKKEVEKDCMAIINALIDEVIAKITQEEYKYMRIKQKHNNQSHKKCDENQPSYKRSTWKKDVDLLNNMESFKIAKNGTVHFRADDTEKDLNYNRQRRIMDRHHVRGKLSLQAHPPLTPDDCGPKRIYQKSEIREGNKCIEILEILEYVDSSQSSPETTNSDENLNVTPGRGKKSKIPIPIYERIQKLPIYKGQKPYRSSPILNCEKNHRSSRLIASMLIDAISDDSDVNIKDKDIDTSLPPRRASVPQHETRSRSNSLRFKQVFDIIPEEKSSLSIESPVDDINYNRRVSAPTLSGNFAENNNNNVAKSNDDKESKKRNESPKKTAPKIKDTKTVATSPFSESCSDDSRGQQNLKNKNVMTSPLIKSAATSPILSGNKYDKLCGNSAKKSLSSHGTKAGWLGFYKPNKQLLEEEGLKESKSQERAIQDQKSVHTQYDISQSQSTVRTIESEKIDPIIIGKDKLRKNEKSQTRESKSKTDKQKETKRKKPDKLKQENETKDRQKVIRDNSLYRSLSDPQSKDVFIRKTDKKKIQMISVEKSEEEIINPKPLKLSNASKDKNVYLSTSESDSDSAKSLLCSLAPKWLSVGNMRQKRQIRKKAQEHQSQQNSAALPADVEMRLSFPKNSAQQVTSQSDSGFGDECRTRRPIAAASKQGCQCRHCDDCTCSNSNRREEQNDSYPPILPPAGRKMTVTMRKESSGSSILASKSMKKSTDPLPDVETYKASKVKTKNSVKMRRGYSLHCWLPGETPPPITTNNDLSVMGCAIIPEIKPRVPTMSERDLTRVYTPRHYLRS